MDSQKLQGLLKRLKSELEQLYGPRLKRLLLFGSYARGDAEPQSDIDVLVVLKAPVAPYREISRTGRIVASLSLENEAVISCQFVSEEDFHQEHSPFLSCVRREALSVC